MPKSVMVVFSNPASPEQEEEYNRWYSERHVKEVLASVPGVVGATRYKLDKTITSSTGAPANPCSYLAIYEIEGNSPEELKTISEALAQAVQHGDVDISPALDLGSLQSSYAIPITETLR